MDLERRLDIETPDGVPISLTLAGLGSRMLAAVVDAAIVAVVLILGFVAMALTGLVTADLSSVGVALLGVLVLVLLVGMPIAFETLASGRTIGKMAVGLRVVMDDGSPITLWPSTVRNLARFVDLLPGMYVAGFISILATKREQRLGDLMAGTVVVRDRITKTSGHTSEMPAGPPWDVRMVTEDDMAVIGRFLGRADELRPAARHKLANTIANAVVSKVSGAPSGIAAEAFLRGVVAYKRAETD